MKSILLSILPGLWACLAGAQSVSLGGIFPASGSGTANGVSVNWVLGNLAAADGPSAPLPVELFAFGGKATAEGAALSWKTAWEKTNKGFEVQKSIDALTFSPIGWVAGVGDSYQIHTYGFIDSQFSTTSYYRLRQVDVDGRVSFSPIISVTPLAESVDNLLAYPNPSPDGRITVRLPQRTSQLRLTNGQGQLVQTIVQPSNQQNLSLPSPGLYLLHIQTPTASRTIKLIRP